MEKAVPFIDQLPVTALDGTLSHVKRKIYTNGPPQGRQGRPGPPGLGHKENGWTWMKHGRMSMNNWWRNGWTWTSMKQENLSCTAQETHEQRVHENHAFPPLAAQIKKGWRWPSWYQCTFLGSTKVTSLLQWAPQSVVKKRCCSFCAAPVLRWFGHPSCYDSEALSCLLHLRPGLASSFWIWSPIQSLMMLWMYCVSNSFKLFWKRKSCGWRLFDGETPRCNSNRG